MAEEGDDGLESRALFTVIEIACGLKELEVETRRRAATANDAAERLMNGAMAKRSDVCSVFMRSCRL